MRRGRFFAGLLGGSLVLILVFFPISTACGQDEYGFIKPGGGSPSWGSGTPLPPGPSTGAAIALHVQTPVTKGICTTAAPAVGCSGYTTGGLLNTSYFVYLMVAQADSAGGIRGVSCGIRYPASFLVEWHFCADGLEFRNNGYEGDWPISGGGNRMTWMTCQQTTRGSEGVHAVVGYFSVYAYAAGQLEVTPNENLVSGPETIVASCEGHLNDVSPTRLAKAGFGMAGYNPCGGSFWYLDSDEDGYGDPDVSVQSPTQPPGYVGDGTDCDDGEPLVHPGAPELCDGLDNDCDGNTPPNEIDSDGDTFRVCAGDCDDGDPLVHPGAPELCDGLDNDCDGNTPPIEIDSDGDTFRVCAGDCDDGDPLVHPGALESCNGNDDDCDGFVPPQELDQDGDEYRGCQGDCDDTNPAIHPGAVEACANGADDDCDGLVDEDCPEFGILSVGDVGNDQGRLVRIRWSPHPSDQAGSPTVITGYSIYRRVAAGMKPGPIGSTRTLATPPGQWDYVLTVPATGETEYGTVVPTLCDSTAAGVCWSVFFVRAHEPAPLDFFDSLPDSGYSIDNLAPGAPENLIVAYSASGNTLTWSESEDTDFDYFKIYRGDRPDFEPSPSSMVGTTVTPSWEDDPGFGPLSHYKVAVVDLSGNESAASGPQTVTGLPETRGDSRLLLFPASPNPFSTRLSIRYQVPSPGGRVELNVFDVRGRLIRTLIDAYRGAGPGEVIWNGDAEDGTLLPGGVYYLRLRAAGAGRTQRLVLTR